MSAQLTLYALLALSPAAGPPSHPWTYEIGLTGDQLNARAAELRSVGFRPVCVSGYNLREDSRFAVVWEKGKGPAWSVGYGLTPDALDQRARDLKAAGFRPAALSGYDLVGDQGFIDLWRKEPGPSWSVGYGMDADGLRQLAARMRGRGYRPRTVSSYVSGTISRYASIWEKGGDVEWDLRWGLTGAAFDDALRGLSSQGFRPVAVGGLGVELEDRFCAVWEKRTGPAWIVRYGLDAGGLDTLARTMRFKGYRPAHLTGYNTLNGPRFATIWEKDEAGR